MVCCDVNISKQGLRLFPPRAHTRYCAYAMLSLNLRRREKLEIEKPDEKRSLWKPEMKGNRRIYALLLPSFQDFREKQKRNKFFKRMCFFSSR